MVVSDRGTWDEAKGRVRAYGRAIDERLPDRLTGIARRVADREIILTASSLAFYGLVSALPLLLLTFAAIEAIAGDDTLQQFTDLAADRGPEGSGEFLDQLVEGGGALTLTTVLFTIWPATAYGGGLRRALLKSVDEADALPGLRGRLIGLSLVFALPALVLAGVPLMFTLSVLAGEGLVGTVLGLVGAVVAGGALGTLIITLLYRAFTPESLPWLATLKGASVTALATTVFSLLFVVYLNVGDTEERFGGGTIAIVVLLGLWLFVANILLLAGYQAVLELEDHDGRSSV